MLRLLGLDNLDMRKWCNDLFLIFGYTSVSFKWICFKLSIRTDWKLSNMNLRVIKPQIMKFWLTKLDFCLKVHLKNPKLCPHFLDKSILKEIHWRIFVTFCAVLDSKYILINKWLTALWEMSKQCFSKVDQGVYPLGNLIVQ